MLIVDKILTLLTGLISRESWLAGEQGLLFLGKGPELCLKASFPLLLRVEQCENRGLSALPGIRLKEKYREAVWKGPAVLLA